MNLRAARLIVAALILLICAFLAFQALTLQVGLRRYSAGQFQSAMPWLRAAMVLNPYNPCARNAVAWILISQKRYDEAERIARKGLKNRPNDPKRHNLLAMILEFKGDSDNALLEYQTALKLDPNYATAFFNTGYLLFKLNRLDEANKAFDRAVQLDPDLKKTRDEILNSTPPKSKNINK